MNAPAAATEGGPAWESWAIALAFAAILGLTLGGGLYLRTGLSEVRAEIPQIEATKLREGFIALGDLQRLKGAFDEAADSPAMTAAQREAVVAALDFLYLRADSFRQLHAAEGGSGIPAFVTLLDTIVAEGDAALATGELSQFKEKLGDRIAAARVDLVRYVDAQHQAQIAAVARQERELARMTLAAAILLIMFGVLSSGSVLLLKAELRANRKRMAAEEQARLLAYFDPLTGLLNRTSLTDRGGEILRGGDGPVLILLDLDNFKALNDKHGHAAGDAVLRSVGRALDRITGGAGGIAARLGGDEFVALLPGPLSLRGTGELGQHLIREIDRPVRFDRLVLSAKCSLGICRADDLGEDPTTLANMMKSADLALYEAKAAGRGTFRLFDGELAAEIAGRHEIENALPRALAADEFRVAYQPQVDLSTGRLYGVEALVRWQRGSEVVPPARFIPTAEQTGIICDIDLWVLRTAARRLAGWLARGAPDLRLSVNLSSLHFRNERIVEQVQDVLLENALPPALLTLEITESVLIENPLKATRIINRLHAVGVNVSLDDFGTGYSGLGYLQDMHVDEIKIDRRFVHRLAGSDEARHILKAVIGMARGLGLTIVAEGIETERQTEMTKSFGCDIGQGFLYGRPMPAEEIEATILDAVRVPVAATADAAAR